MPSPVIFVPGLPSAHLRDTNSDRRFYLKLGLSAFDNPLLRGPNDLQTNDGVREDGPIASAKLGPIDLVKQAKSLYKLLRRHGIESVKFGWAARLRLARAIRDLRRSSGERVTIIAHSTGGLVLRSCLEAEPQLAVSIKKIITFGVPWAGTPQSMLYVNRQSGFAGGLVSPRKAQEIVVHSWGGFDLFPPDPTHLFDEDNMALNLTYRQQGTGKRQISALTDRHWINSLPEGSESRRDPALHSLPQPPGAASTDPRPRRRRHGTQEVWGLVARRRHGRCAHLPRADRRLPEEDHSGAQRTVEQPWLHQPARSSPRRSRSTSLLLRRDRRRRLESRERRRQGKGALRRPRRTGSDAR